MNERTFIALKPDGVQRKLVGEIIGRFERKGFRLVALKLLQVWKEHTHTQTHTHVCYVTNCLCMLACNRNWANCICSSLRALFSIGVVSACDR